MGRRILRRMRLPTLDKVEKTVFAIGIGLGVLAYLVFFLGILGLLYKSAIISLLLVLTSFFPWRARFPRMQKINLKSFPWELLLFLPWFSLVFLAALSPPIDWDGLAYHLAVPKLYISAHRIYWVQFIHHSNFPFLMEMLYTIPLIIGMVDACKLFHLLFALLIMALLYNQLRKNSRVGGVLALLFLTQMVLFSWESTIAYNDLAFSFYVLLAFLAFLKEETLLTGLAIGFALGTKHLALSFLLSLLILFPFYREGKLVWRWDGRTIWRRVGTLLFPAFLLALPWYLKSYIYTGNPVYPFLYNIFGGRLWSSEAATAYREAQLSIGTGRDILSFLLLPWNLTFHPEKFFDPGANRFFAMIGPVFLAFCPLLLKEPISLLFIALSGIQWFFLSQNIRYLLPILVVLPLPLAKGLNRLWKKPFNILFGLILSISYLLHLLIFGLIMYPTFGVALGREDREEFIGKFFPSYKVFQFVNQYLPLDSKIALLGEPRGFYLGREYMWADPGHHTLIPYKRFRTVKELVESYKRMGFTHIIINQEFAPGNPLSDNPLDKLLVNPSACPYIELVYSKARVYLFRIK